MKFLLEENVSKSDSTVDLTKNTYLKIKVLSEFREFLCHTDPKLKFPPETNANRIPHTETTYKTISSRDQFTRIDGYTSRI